MKNPKTIQDANLTKQKINACCSQAEVHVPETALELETEKNPPHQKEELPPYYHREIF